MAPHIDTASRHRFSRKNFAETSIVSRRGLLLALAGAGTAGAVLSGSADRALAASGRQLWVSPTGSDSAPGSAAQPFRTLVKALGVLRPGDTLTVRGGTYKERIQNPRITAGTSSARITVQAAAGERPVIEGLLWLREPSFWDVRGLVVTWGAKNSKNEHMVKITGGRGWTLSGNEFFGARSYAALLVAGAANDWFVSDNYIHDTVRSNDTNQDHLVYVNSSGANGVVEGNVLTGSPNGRAIKVGPPSAGSGTVKGLKIRYNTMSRNQGPSNVQLAWGSSDVEIHHNVMEYPASGRSAVTAYQLTGTGNTVHDNVVWGTLRAVDAGVAGVKDTGGNAVKDPALVGSGMSLRCTSAPGFGAN